jgi:hypothetical protein
MSLNYGPDLSRNSKIKNKYTFIMLHVYMIPEILLVKKNENLQMKLNDPLMLCLISIVLNY